MQKTKKYNLDQVFGMAAEDDVNYVERSGVDRKMRRSLQTKQHIAVFGRSRQGKTRLIRHVLSEDQYIPIQCIKKLTLAELNRNILSAAGFRQPVNTVQSDSSGAKIGGSINASVLDTEVALSPELTQTRSTETTYTEDAIDPENVNSMIFALQQVGFDRYILLEDFHCLAREVQAELAAMLKGYSDHSGIRFIITGTFWDKNKLKTLSGDLPAITIIDADQWSDKQLRKVIDQGTEKLNVAFNHAVTEALIRCARGNVAILHELCRRICCGCKIQCTRSEKCLVAENWNVEATLHEAAADRGGGYRRFLTKFARGFKPTKYMLYSWLLVILVKAQPEERTAGLSDSVILKKLQSEHPAGASLNIGHVRQALNAVESLQHKLSGQSLILEYDETDRRLRVLDPWFLVWLEDQSEADLIDVIQEDLCSPV